MKPKHRAILICWLMMITIFSLDIVSTIIGIEFTGAYETNPFLSQIFSLGLIGYPLALIFYAGGFLFLLKSIGILCDFSYKGMTNKELNVESEIAVYCLVASVFVVLDLIAVISNFIVIIT